MGSFFWDTLKIYPAAEEHRFRTRSNSRSLFSLPYDPVRLEPPARRLHQAWLCPSAARLRMPGAPGAAPNQRWQRSTWTTPPIPNPKARPGCLSTRLLRQQHVRIVDGKRIGNLCASAEHLSHLRRKRMGLDHPERRDAQRHAQGTEKIKRGAGRSPLAVRQTVDARVAQHRK